MEEDEIEVPTLIVLNLKGSISKKFRTLLEKKNCQIVTEAELIEDQTIDLIVTHGEDSFGEINNKYSTVGKDIKVIATSEVKDYFEFVTFNGKFVVDDTWVSTNVGEILFDKFLQGAGSIHIPEALNSYFPKQHSMKLISHLRLGYYGDTMAIDAFDHDFNLVSIRGFLYNITYYLSYLKQSGISGVPINIEYAHNDDFFVVNIHASVKNFVSEYMIDSFGKENARDSLRYLLRSALLSTDFLDVTYVQDPSKVVFTGYWAKKTSKTSENYSCFSMNNIATTKQLENQYEKEIKHAQEASRVGEEQLVDYTSKEAELEYKRLPGSLIDEYSPNNEISILYEDPNLSGDLVEHILAKIELEDDRVDIKNIKEEEFIQYIKGHKREEELVQRLSAEDKQLIKDRLLKSDLTTAYEREVRNTRAEEQETDPYVNMMKKMISDQVENKLKQREELNIDYNKLSESLEVSLTKIFEEDRELFDGDRDNSLKAKAIVLENLDKDMGLKGELIDKDIDDVFVKAKHEERKFINNKINDPSKVMNIGLSSREEVLVKMLEKFQKEVDELKRKLHASMIALGSYKKGQEEIASAHESVKKNIVEELKELDEVKKSIGKDDRTDLGVESTDSLISAVKGKELTEKQIEAIEANLKAKMELDTKLRMVELELRKYQLEMEQKDTVFEKQISAIERKSKVKGSALAKSKDSIKLLAERKEKEIKALSKRMNDMSSVVNKLKASGGAGKIKGLEREKLTSLKKIENLRKQAATYQAKVKSLQSNDDSIELARENRTQKRQIAQFEIKVAILEKDIDNHGRRFSTANQEITRIKNENRALLEEKSKLEKKSNIIRESAATDVQKSSAFEEAQPQLLEKGKIVKAMELKIKQLEARVAREEQKKNPGAGKKGQPEPLTVTAEQGKRMKLQIDKLEKDRTKLQDNLRDKTKEATEFLINFKRVRAENSATNNKVKAFEKEIARLKAKTGGKKAA
jgi:hypothetical protein